MSLRIQFAWLLMLALPVACISWTVTHEDLFREPREFAQRWSENARSAWMRKFCYLFTCEFCFSHYVAAFFVAITGFTMLYPAPDWRGFLIAWLALVWIANVYMNVYARLRLEVKRERVEIREVEAEVAAKQAQGAGPRIVKKD